METHQTPDVIKNRIRDFRKNLELTQEALAIAVGVSRQSIISVELGRCTPSIPLALAIARVFHQPIEQVFIMETTTHQLKEEEHMPREIGPFRSFDQMFEDAIMPYRRTNEMVPQMNVYQTDKEFIVEADVPGMQEDDVDIEISDNVLTIKGERKSDTEEKNKEYFHREVSYGSFQRALTLPVEVVPEKATATVKNGQLKVVLPKIEPEQPKVHKLKAKKAE